jgi:hypothetical protein
MYPRWVQNFFAEILQLESVMETTEELDWRLIDQEFF